MYHLSEAFDGIQYTCNSSTAEKLGYDYEDIVESASYLGVTAYGYAISGAVYSGAIYAYIEDEMETSADKEQEETQNEKAESKEAIENEYKELKYCYHVYHFTEAVDGKYYTNDLALAEKRGYDNEDIVYSDIYLGENVMGYDLPGAAYSGAMYAFVEEVYTQTN